MVRILHTQDIKKILDLHVWTSLQVLQTIKEINGIKLNKFNPFQKDLNQHIHLKNQIPGYILIIILQ